MSRFLDLFSYYYSGLSVKRNRKYMLHAGSLVFNPINAWLLYNYDFRVAFRISAAVILAAGSLCSWSFTPADSGAPAELIQDDNNYNYNNYDDNGEWSSSDGESLRRCTSRDVMRRPQIALWYAGNCLSYLGFYMPFLNLVGAAHSFRSLVACWSNLNLQDSCISQLYWSVAYILNIVHCSNAALHSINYVAAVRRTRPVTNVCKTRSPAVARRADRTGCQ